MQQGSRLTRLTSFILKNAESALFTMSSFGSDWVGWFIFQQVLMLSNDSKPDDFMRLTGEDKDLTIFTITSLTLAKEKNASNL